MTYKTIQVRKDTTIHYIKFHRPEEKNTISEQLIVDSQIAINEAKKEATIVVLEGLPDIFCYGADFKEISNNILENKKIKTGPEQMYDLWLDIATGPYITIAHVKGKANAGGIGFVAACDIVLSSPTAEFGLSELLFGLYPACVLPFLIRRTGIQQAHYLTLMTKAISAEDAKRIGLVDAVDANSDLLLKQHLMRLRRISKQAICAYKNYLNTLIPPLEQSRETAIKANQALFSDPVNLQNISRFVLDGRFPWEGLESDSSSKNSWS